MSQNPTGGTSVQSYKLPYFFSLCDRDLHLAERATTAHGGNDVKACQSFAN